MKYYYIGFFLLISSILSPSAVSQNITNPHKPIKLLVGYAPGGATDILARILNVPLTTRFGQQVIIENKSGASGMIAADIVAKSAPDGNTLLLGYTPEVAINKLVFKQMTYDPLLDLEPIALIAEAPLFLVVGTKLPIKSAKELLALKKNSTPLTYGSPGTGGQQHLVGELFQIQTGIKTLHIPYRGAAPVLIDLLGGQLDMFFSSPPVILSQIKAGKLTPIFVTSNQRSPILPDVPSATEIGLPRFEVSNWFGLFAPKGVDPILVDKISNDIKAVLVEQLVISKLYDNGLEPRFMNSKELKIFIASEMNKYSEIINKSGIDKQ